MPVHPLEPSAPEDDGKLGLTAKETLADIWQSLPGFAARLKAYGERVRAETLEEAAKVADGIAAYARRQAERQPAEWTTAAETAELISNKLRSLTTGSAAGEDK